MSRKKCTLIPEGFEITGHKVFHLFNPIITIVKIITIKNDNDNNIDNKKINKKRKIIDINDNDNDKNDDNNKDDIINYNDDNDSNNDDNDNNNDSNNNNNDNDNSTICNGS